MPRLFSRRPSASMVVATIALIVAVGGTAWAAHQIDGKSIKKNSEPGNRIKTRSLPGNRLKKHSVTNSEVDLSSLGAVPESSHASSADHASSAETASNAAMVGGLAVVKFDQAGVVPFASPVTVLSLAGLEIKYACELGEGDYFLLRATTTVNGASISLARNYYGGATWQSDLSFNTGDFLELLGFVGTGVYTAPGGKVVTFTYRHFSLCSQGVAGTAIGG